MVPTGGLKGGPPAKVFPPAPLGQVGQSAARARYSPRATNSSDGTTSGAEISGSRSSRRHETAEPTITTTVNAATPMILSHLDPIIFMASPIVEWSKNSNLSWTGSLGGRGSHPKATVFLYPETLGRPAGDLSSLDSDRLPRSRSRRVRAPRASRKQWPRAWFFRLPDSPSCRWRYTRRKRQQRVCLALEVRRGWHSSSLVPRPWRRSRIHGGGGQTRQRRKRYS